MSHLMDELSQHHPQWDEPDCPSCGEGCGGHDRVRVCAFDEEDWPCFVMQAKEHGFTLAVAKLRDRDAPLTRWQDHGPGFEFYSDLEMASHLADYLEQASEVDHGSE